MPLRIKKRGKVWHFEGTVAGRRLRGTTGATDKAVAQRIAAETEAKEWRRRCDGLGAEVTFAQAAMSYRDAGKPTRFLELVEDYWKDTLVRDITPGAIRQAATKLYPAAAGATRNRQAIVPIQAIINHAAELEWCTAIRVKRFPVATRTKVPATREWVQAFAKQAHSDDLRHLAALCLFMFGTGARRGEACALRWSDVDLFAKTAVIRQTKVEDTRIAHLPAPVVVSLANIPSNRRAEDLVFGYATGESVGQVWRNVVTRAGIRQLSPHCCRHGFATTMLQAGIDPKTVAVRGGWKDVATVMKHYAHAMADPTVTDVLFGTKLTQGSNDKTLTNGKKRNKSQ
ncbi:MAG: site-specific integrase [Rhizobiaceae bacterium]